ncbi:hypothetical protein TNCV_1265101 [Trichonephila clavipes]|nr:hypothetical protein TNCV_1265101 [Trichonephila clavipes]
MTRHLDHYDTEAPYIAEEATIKCGCGSRVVLVSERGLPCHELKPSTSKDPRVEQRCTLNLYRAETSSRWCSVFGLAIHQNDHQARRRFVEWAQNEIAVVPDFHKRILFSDEAHFWLNGYVNKQNCRIWSQANPQVYVETRLHPEKLTVWCALWAGGILLQKR